MIDILLAEARQQEIQATERRSQHQREYAMSSRVERLEKALTTARQKLRLSPVSDQA